MTLKEITLALGETVLYKNNEYLLNAVILRKKQNNEFEYQAELKDTKAKSSLIIVNIFSIERKTI